MKDIVKIVQVTTVAQSVYQMTRILFVCKKTTKITTFFNY